MSYRSTPRPRPSRPARHLVPALLAAGVAAPLQAQPAGPPATTRAADAAPAASAASAPPRPAAQAVSRVIVVGLRASVASAQALKRERLDITESVVADDIDKLPDASVTEALQRVTGIQIARDRGEGTGVTIRGLTQVESTLDGREVFTAGTARALDFADFPSELVAGVDVYKTSSASRLEGGVGGQVDLRTRQPFDFSHGAAAASVRVVRGDLVDRSDTQVSGLASRRMVLPGAGELGFLVAAAVQHRPFREDQKNTGAPTARDDLVPGSTVVAPNGTSETTSAGLRTRDAVQVALQWRPSPAVELYAQASAFELRTTQDSYQINVGASATVLPGSVALFPGTQDVRQVTWTNAPISVLSFARDTVDRTRLAAVGGHWTFADWHLHADLSRTTAYDNLFFSGPFFAGTAAQFTQDLAGTVPSSSVSGTDLLDPTAFHYTGVAYRTRPFNGTLNAAQLDGDRGVDAGWLRELAFGLRAARRGADDGAGLVFADAPVSGLTLADVPGLAVPNPYGNFLPASSAPSLRQYLVGSLAQARDATALRAELGVTAPIPAEGSPLGLWHIGETSAAAYAMATLGAPAGAWDGRAGLRVVRTHETVDGNASVPASGAVEPIAVDTTSVDVLPSATLRWRLGGGHVLRAAVSRTITRPNFDQLSPSLTLIRNSIDPSLNQGSAGNPELRPIRADNVDLAFETYHGASTSASATVFFKHVDGFVTLVSQPEVHDGDTYQVTRPQNSQAATIKGVELAWQHFFTGLPGAWRGLGLQVNATYVDSRMPGGAGGPSLPLSNLSRHSANAVGMYEHGPVTVRIAWNWRDRFLSGLSNVVGVGMLPLYTQGYGWLDASVSVRLAEHLTLRLAGSNLTDTLRRTYYGVSTRPQGVWQDDVQYSAALQWHL